MYISMQKVLTYSRINGGKITVNRLSFGNNHNSIQCSQELSTDAKAGGFRVDDGRDYQHNIGISPIKHESNKKGKVVKPLIRLDDQR